MTVIGRLEHPRHVHGNDGSWGLWYYFGSPPWRITNSFSQVAL